MVSHQDLFGEHSVLHTEAPPPYPASTIDSYPPDEGVSQPTYPTAPPPYPASQIDSYPPVGGFSQPTYPAGVLTAPVVEGSSYPVPVVADSSYSPEHQRRLVSQNCGVSVKLLAVS